ncbi:MAG TPA: cell division protein FtsZ, partial [Candidatus Onthomorpha intestinigallinarum]|nr:cell division protein FtsZ [Candidatus Onthomorpha intestinigallinarum]
MDEQIREENIVNCGEILNVEKAKPSSFIKVLGVGGAGTNAVNHMYDKGIKGVDLYVCNTDA